MSWASNGMEMADTTRAENFSQEIKSRRRKANLWVLGGNLRIANSFPQHWIVAKHDHVTMSRYVMCGSTWVKRLLILNRSHDLANLVVVGSVS